MPEWFPFCRKCDDQPAAYILFKNATIYDGTSDALSEVPMDVLIHKNYIKSIIPHDGQASHDKIFADLPPGTDEIIAIVDCTGMTLLPGFIDMHAHLAVQEGLTEGNNWDQMAMGAMMGKDCLDYLLQGFTTARDAGGNVLGLAKAINKNRELWSPYLRFRVRTK